MRQQLLPHQQKAASKNICRNLGSTALFRNSRRIAGYISNENEPNLTPLMELAWSRKQHWHLPIIGLPNINHLWFAPYASGAPLTLNRFGIEEPDIHLYQTPKPWGLDLILMPLVAFDANGNRLGMGKGYYDRTLKFLRHRCSWRKPRLVGIAYEFQRIDTLPFQPWDIPLDAIVTEKTVYNIAQLPL